MSYAVNVPNPGSTAARAKGCRCAVVDNGYGKGAYTDERGRPQFWISDDCPLHGSLAGRSSETEE